MPFPALLLRRVVVKALVEGQDARCNKFNHGRGHAALYHPDHGYVWKLRVAFQVIYARPKGENDLKVLHAREQPRRRRVNERVVDL